MQIRILIYCTVLVSFFGCGDSFVEDTGYTEENGYYDGKYCASVTYYNSNTGTQSTYTLNVDVEQNAVIKINWSNGGWLDEDHFYPANLDANGYTEFTSDQGYEYTVQIDGPECYKTDESQIVFDLKRDSKLLTCPECGADKSRYDEYCYFCQQNFICDECGGVKDKYEEYCYYCLRNFICDNCGGRKSKYYDLCDDCQRREDEDYY